MAKRMSVGTGSHLSAEWTNDNDTVVTQSLHVASAGPWLTYHIDMSGYASWSCKLPYLIAAPGD